MKIKLRDLSSLNHADLDLYYDELDEMNEHIENDHLASVCCANELLLLSRFTKVSYQSQMSPVFLC
ncbi:hypothetical protein H5410_060725 [Solanum commersonii]|uniref:Uncharacterized protein n=1 Tax=Solanum commersonii TaxID=4109 RepID=A0A9J5W6I5_SOLCO|nr:hypothetical protein H5410_060725 [Solanum commersonii]